MTESRPLRALICDHDATLRRTLGGFSEDAGFEVVAEVDNVIEALQILAATRATLVLLTAESLATNPMAIVAELRQGDPPAEVILLAPEDSSRDQALELGLFDLTLHGDAEALVEALSAVALILRTGERRRRPERRTGTERRERQDWSKVTAQRRDVQRRRLQRRPTEDAPRNGSHD
jgi:DNA-binding NarL/FixJ family response regulator